MILKLFLFFFSNSLQGLLGGPIQTTLPSDRLAWTSSPAGLAPCRWSIHRWDWTQSCSRTRSPSSARNTGTLRGSDRTGAPSGETPHRGRRERETLEGRSSSRTTPGWTGSDKALSSTQHIANDHSAAAARTWCGKGWIGNEQMVLGFEKRKHRQTKRSTQTDGHAKQYCMFHKCANTQHTLLTTKNSWIEYFFVQHKQGRHQLGVLLFRHICRMEEEEEGRCLWSQTWQPHHKSYFSTLATLPCLHQDIILDTTKLLLHSLGNSVL